MKNLWAVVGTIAFWVTWPLIFVYARITPPRTRVLLIHDTEILVVKNWLGASSWALPGGGRHRGEAPITAAVREVSEETGIFLDEAAIIDLGQHRSNITLGLQSKYYLFAVRLTEKPPLTLQQLEIMAAEWKKINDLLTASNHVSATVKDSLEVWISNQNLLS